MIIRVQNIINYNLQSFFEDYLTLMTKHRQLISSYYTNGTIYPKSSFDFLGDLRNRSYIILEKIASNRDSLSNFSDFEVVDAIESIVNSFDILDNYSRWLRSSLFNGKFRQNAEVDIILKQNQTLEDFSQEIGYINRDIGAIDIALRNNIKETDLTLEGGVIFKFSYLNGEKLILNSVVDNLSGSNLLGKDLASKLTFSSDDLMVLSPEETFYQSCGNLLSLLRKDNPEFPFDGFDKLTLSNRNVVNNMIPSFIRQLYEVVYRDDSIANFSVSDIEVKGDSLRVEVSFRSWLNNEIKQSINGN